jgi:hypothetical protein
METTSRPALAGGSKQARKSSTEGCEVVDNAGRLAQPGIEGIEVVVMMLGPQITIPADIQAHLANPPVLDHGPG